MTILKLSYYVVKSDGFKQLSY